MTQTIRLSKLHRWTGRKVGHARYEDQVKWAKGGSQPTSSHRRYVMGPVFYRQENSAFNSQSKLEWSHMTIDGYLHGPVWPTKNCERSGMTHTKTVLFNHWIQMQNGTIRPRRSQQWFDKRSKRTFLQNLHISILVLDFSLVGPRPLYSFLGNEESRIFGSC